MHRLTTSATALLVLSLSSLTAQAQVSVGVGAIAAPQFEGSKDFTVRAAPSFSFKSESFSVRTVGPGIEADLLSSRAIDAGPILRYNFGRKGSDIDNAQVSALPDIDGGVELGGYAQVNIPVGGFKTFLSPRISIVQGVQGGATGMQIQAGLGLVRLQGDWTFGARTTTTYANADYMNTNFGVGAGSASGLGSFTADAGIKDAGLSLFANYKINEQFSVTGIVGYKVLMGDAADSPIVSVAGSNEQMFVTLGVSYGF